MTGTNNRRCDVTLGLRSGVSERTIVAIELVLDIVVLCTDPGIVEPINSQLSAVRECQCFVSFIDPEAHTFFNLDLPVSNDELLHHAIELNAWPRRLRKSAERSKDCRVPDACPYPISVPIVVAFSRRATSRSILPPASEERATALAELRQ